MTDGGKNTRIVNAMLGRGLGGIEQAVMDYAEALTIAGYEAHTIIDSHAAIIPAMAAQHLPYTSMRNKGAWDLWAVARLRRQLDAIHPAACIAHGNRAVSLLKRAAGRRFPVIGVMHNYKIHGRGLAHMICPTEHLRTFVKTQGMEDAHISVVANLVRVSPRILPRSAHHPIVIGAMGRMVAKKGFDVLIEALSLLAAKNVPFQVVMAGEGEERGTLEALTVKRGLRDKVTFSGWATDKQAFFDAIDVFCLPSMHEPFGIVLLEAMAQHIPVVAAASEGPREIITDNVDGMLVPPGNSDALAGALSECIYSPGHRARLGESAYATAKRAYDLPVVAAKLDLALRQVRPL